ncbi:Pyruvate,water dikinase [Rubrobacter xylanophilus DSM 9941]|uniref:Phosphoenolpyruvate synthase n=1 Tax=Rubrobacter xylanophilus (strain DSM 9941 / JCM 11954 / NBRC 16129 / PRD-1) TaxID=266117 RepID=Q1AVP2_RUBXD|nr:PEP/pyruvate-binding domain-containing protein [Rubrobacter xylanophilus]ABG04536.1 Pyruvate,water dikinase [Rubrobacter xylanophilus DSM 9941]
MVSSAATGYTTPLDRLRRAEEPRFGGKSANLGELLSSEIPVPPGFAISTDAFALFLEENGIRERVVRSLRALDPDDMSALRRVSEELVAAVLSAPLPGEVVGEVERRYRKIAELSGEESPPVAVRSSAVGEDSEQATFAGQQKTHLWVRGVDDVCAAVRSCWASLYSPEALSYRARMSAGGGEPAMGVAVQMMVDAEVAGVMFTCNPLNGDPSTVAVNASWGLGEAVVAGEVTPDEYRVSKVTGEVLRRSVGCKHLEYRPDPGSAGVRAVEVEQARREVPCLDEACLRALVEVARRVERHFGAPQDIEWAISRGRELPESLYVLQSRPVTTAPRRPEAGKDLPRARSAIELVMGTFGVVRDDEGRS